MKRIIIISLCLLFQCSFIFADRTDVLSTNPQKTLQLQRRQTGDKQGGDIQFVDFVDLSSGKIIFSFSSIWRSTDGGWSPNGLLACVNDRIATSGDFLYIFRLMDGHLTLLRQPNDHLFWSISNIYQKRGSSGRFTLTAREWLNDASLRVRVTSGGYGREDSDFDATVNVDGAGRISFDPKSVASIK